MLQLAQIAATRDGGVQALDPLTAVASRAHLQEKAEAVRAGQARGRTYSRVKSAFKTLRHIYFNLSHPCDYHACAIFSFHPQAC
jgi:hypothetical protein